MTGIERMPGKQSIGSEEYGKLLSCPFCGGAAGLIVDMSRKSHNQTGNIPEGCVVYDTTESWDGRTIYHYYRQRYTVQCGTAGCFCGTCSNLFDTPQEAVDAWNNRST